MIILILLILIIGFCISCVAMFQNKKFIPLALLTLLGMGGSLWLIAQNDTQHLGMQVATTETKTKLASSYQSPLPFLVYRQLGSQNDPKERVYAYRQIDRKQRQQTSHTHFTVQLQTQKPVAKHAQLVKKVQTYQFKNQFWQLLFYGNQARPVKKTTYIFQIPQNWLVLESRQAKDLDPIAKKLAAQKAPQAAQQVKQRLQQTIRQQVQAKAPAQIKRQLTARIRQDPQIRQNAAQYRSLQQVITAKVTQALTAQVTASVEKRDLPKLKQAAAVQTKAEIAETLQQKFDHKH